MNIATYESTIALLKEIAAGTSFYDDDTEGEFDICSACGGNFDDAFFLGEKAGAISLARRLLKKLEVEV